MMQVRTVSRAAAWRSDDEPFRWLATPLALLLLSGCASNRLDDGEKLALYQANAGAPVKSFSFFGSINGWTPLGDEAIAVWTKPSEAYLLGLYGPCRDLPFSQVISVTSQMNRVSAGFDKVMVHATRGSIDIHAASRKSGRSTSGRSRGGGRNATRSAGSRRAHSPLAFGHRAEQELFHLASRNARCLGSSGERRFSLISMAGARATPTMRSGRCPRRRACPGLRHGAKAAPRSRAVRTGRTRAAHAGRSSWCRRSCASARVRMGRGSEQRQSSRATSAGRHVAHAVASATACRRKGRSCSR